MHPQLHLYHIAHDVVAFSSTRRGGVSNNSYGEFNINLWCGDSNEHTSRNLELLASELGINADRIIIPHQVHKTLVRTIDDSFFQLSLPDKAAYLDGVDAIVTNKFGICIGVSTADCIPVLLYDPVHRVSAAVHAGWRGTQQRIVVNTIETMQKQYNCNPCDLQAVIGPGISLKAFEVGQEVYDAFAEADFDMPLISEKKEKWHIDLPLCNKLQLIHCGVLESNIQSSDICTYSNYNDFFSARRLGIHSGRIYTGILMK